MRDGGRGGECAEEFAEFAEGFADGVSGGLGHDCVAAGGGGAGLRITASAYLSTRRLPCLIHVAIRWIEFVQVGASVGRGAAAVEPLSWGDVGGLEEVKTRLGARDHRRDIRRDTRRAFEKRGVVNCELIIAVRAIQWPILHACAYRRMAISPPRGVLLHGPPGCSKTTLARQPRYSPRYSPRYPPRYPPSVCGRAAASVAGVAFLYLSAAEVYSPYVGEAERAVRKTYLRLT